jgi:hypothetical protein
MKSRAGIEALINNYPTTNLDLLLIQEPLISTYHTHINHSAWGSITLRDIEEAIQFHSLFYINKQILTSSHHRSTAISHLVTVKI